MVPKSIRRGSPERLTITWNDGHVSDYALRDLREGCPCAVCKGETVLMHSYTPAEPDRTVPGRYDLKDVRQVGSYAVQMTWGDGHSTGIYTWETLLRLCPCGEHSS